MIDPPPVYLPIPLETTLHSCATQSTPLAGFDTGGHARTQSPGDAVGQAEIVHLRLFVQFSFP